MKEVKYQMNDKYSIVASLAAKHRLELEELLASLVSQDIDILEFRADIYEDNDFAGVKDALTLIRDAQPSLPLLFTLRSKEEGGVCPLASWDYIEFNRAIVKEDLVDLIDLEYGHLKDEPNDLLDLAAAHQLDVILSHHDFEKTPSTEEIVTQYKDMLALKPLVAKLAFMPQVKEDVINLLEACRLVKESQPSAKLVAISMGELGRVSRSSGGLFGSSWTYAAIGEAAAPGQVHYRDLRLLLDNMYNN